MLRLTKIYFKSVTRILLTIDVQLFMDNNYIKGKKILLITMLIPTKYNMKERERRGRERQRGRGGGKVETQKDRLTDRQRQ